MDIHWGGFGIGLVGLFANLLFLALIATVVVLLVRTLSRPSQGPAGLTSAKQILAERFARGEIDAEEYQARLGVLSGEAPPAQPQ